MADNQTEENGPDEGQGYNLQAVQEELAEELAEVRDRVIETLKTCYDPEIPVDIYELGLIYEVNIDDGYFIDLKMTLTSPMCPVAGSLPPEVESKVAITEGVAGAVVELVWDPPWNPDMMSEEAKLDLGM